MPAQKTLFQKALHREVVATPPIWMMRQAGRYHQHYQALRAKHSFMDLCKKPALAAEVAMGPIRDFDFDAAILFSDLLFPLEVLGMPLSYDPAPTLGWHLESESQILNFKKTSEALKGLEFQAEALIQTRQILPQDKSLIAFVGGPWTLFVYAVEGSHKGHLLKSLQQVGLYKKFCEQLLPLLKLNIEMQLKAGAELVMIFDTAAGEVPPAFFEEHIAPYVSELASSQVAYYTKGGTWDHYQYLGQNFAGLGYDHRFLISEVLKKQKTGFVQGNFHQNYLTLESSAFKAHLEKYIAELKTLTPEQRAGWVCGLGHGVIPQAREENVKYFVQKIREEFK
jgi:uroporphyrinogen decarboxylase